MNDATREAAEVAIDVLLQEKREFLPSPDGTDTYPFRFIALSDQDHERLSSTIKMMQQQGYGQPPQQGAQGYAARMQAQQQNPMMNVARAPVAYQPQPMPTPQPAQRYAPTAPAAQPHPVSAMNATAPAAQVHVGNPVQAGMQAQASGGAGLAMSDATQKVIAEPSLADSFLEHMRPYSYRYKDPRMEPRVAPTGGIYLGVMAQDLEKIPHLGSQLVVQTPQGKMVDQKTALSATMAGLARVFERVKALESDALNRRK